MKEAKVNYFLTARELIDVPIGSTAQEKLQWLLSFVNHGEWKRIKVGPGLYVLQFTPKLLLNHGQWNLLTEQLEAFCGIENYEKPLQRAELIELHDLAAQIVKALANKGVVMEDLPGCKIVLFPDHSNRRIAINLTGDRRARFLLEIKRTFDGLDLGRLRSCPTCLRLFYAAIRLQRYCGVNCSNRMRQRSYYKAVAKKRSLGKKKRQLFRAHRGKHCSEESST